MQNRTWTCKPLAEHTKMPYCRLKQAHMPHFEICNHTGHSVWPEVGTFQDEASFNPPIPEELAAAEAKQQALVAEGYTPPMPLTSQSPVISFKSLPTMLMKTVCALDLRLNFNIPGRFRLGSTALRK
jgi:hypothetical protein